MVRSKKGENQPLQRRLCSKRGKKNWFAQSWWVILFLSICSIVYSYAAHKKDEVITILDEQIHVLKQEQKILQQEKDDLLSQVNSQGDPAWIELTLMKGLGLVPQGQWKVYFYDNDD